MLESEKRMYFVFFCWCTSMFTPTLVHIDIDMGTYEVMYLRSKSPYYPNIFMLVLTYLIFTNKNNIYLYFPYSILLSKKVILNNFIILIFFTGKFFFIYYAGWFLASLYFLDYSVMLLKSVRYFVYLVAKQLASWKCVKPVHRVAEDLYITGFISSSFKETLEFCQECLYWVLGLFFNSIILSYSFIVIGGV